MRNYSIRNTNVGVLIVHIRPQYLFLLESLNLYKLTVDVTSEEVGGPKVIMVQNPLIKTIILVFINQIAKLHFQLFLLFFYDAFYFFYKHFNKTDHSISLEDVFIIYRESYEPQKKTIICCWPKTHSPPRVKLIQEIGSTSCNNYSTVKTLTSILSLISLKTI